MGDNICTKKKKKENNRKGKTRDLFKKIRVTKGTFHAKVGTIKDRNGMDLTEAEDIKKRWQEYWGGLPFPSPLFRLGDFFFFFNFTILYWFCQTSK